MKLLPQIEIDEISRNMSAIEKEIEKAQNNGFYDETYIEEKLNLLEDILLDRDD